VSFYKRVLFRSRVFWAFFLSLSLAAGAGQSSISGPRREVVSEKEHNRKIKEAASVPIIVPALEFTPLEHFSLKYWKQFNSALQSELCCRYTNALLASIAPGKCFGSENKDHYGVNDARIFFDSSKKEQACSNPLSETGPLIRKEHVEGQKRILMVALSQEKDFLAQLSRKTDAFELESSDWIVIFVNDAPHLELRFLTFKNYIVVPSVKMLTWDFQLFVVVVDGKPIYPAPTMAGDLISRLGAQKAPEALAKRVADALSLFDSPAAV